MNRLTGKVSRRIIAALLTIAMVASNMTVYASEQEMAQTQAQTGINDDVDSAAMDVSEDASETQNPSVVPESGGVSEDGAAEDDGVTGSDAASEEANGGTASDSGASGEGMEDMTAPEGEADDGTDAEDKSLDLDEEDSDNSEETSEFEAEKPLGDTSSGSNMETVEYIVDADTLATRLVANSGDTIANGTILGDYFSTVDTVYQCWDDSSNGDYLKVQSKSRGAIKFTVTGSAKLEIEAGCVNNDASTYIILADPANDEYKKLDKDTCTAITFPNDEGQDTVTNRAKQKRTWTKLEAGTYVICTNGTDATTRGKDLRIYTLKVTETRAARGDWTAVAKPTITSVEKDAADQGKINVTVLADVSDNGGDKLEVEMYKGTTASGDPQEVQTSREETDTHTFSFSPTETGTYCFKAILSRVGAAPKECDVIKDITLTIPLETPKNLAVTEQISGETLTSVTLSWDEVKEVDHYEVVVTDNGAAVGTAPVYQKADVNKSVKSIVITAQEAGLVRGKTYKFSLTAVREGTGADKSDEKVTASIAKKISSGRMETKTYVFDPSTMEDTGYMLQADKGGVADGTVLGTDVYFSIGIYKSDSGCVTNEGQYVRLRQKSEAGIEFSVEGNAKVEVYAASTGGTNKSPIALQKIVKGEDGKTIASATSLAEKNGETTAYTYGNKKPNDCLTWEDLDAGTYRLISPTGTGDDGKDLNRDVTIYSVEVTETSNRAERTDLASVIKPEVTNVTNNNGILSVNVTNALVGYDGGDRLVVVLEDSNHEEVSGARGASAIPGSSHTVSVNLASCKTGAYTVRAKLIRGVGTDKKELSGEVTKSLSYVQEIKAPTGLYAANMGKTAADSGSVKLSWNSALGAQYYVIKVVDENGTETRLDEKVTSTAYTIDSGLEIGKKYTFKVYAASELDGEEYLSKNAAVEENYEIIEGIGDAPFAVGEYQLIISSDITKFDESAKQDGEKERVGTNKFFTMIYNSSSKVEALKEAVKFSDDSEESVRLSFNSSARTVGGSIKFATSASARVTVYWQAAGNGREMKIIDGEDNELKSTNIGTLKDETYISKFYFNDAGIYYLGSKGGNNYIYKVIVDNGYTGAMRPEWSTVADPAMEVKQVEGDVSVKVKAKIGSEGIDAEADKVVVTMYDENGEAAGSARTVLEGAVDPELIITPASSGKYRFEAELSRDDEPVDKWKHSKYPTEENEFFNYTLPLGIPALKAENVKNKGAVDADKKHGSAELSWDSVKEADGYIVKVKGKDTEYEKEYSVTVPAILINEDLEVDKTYEFSVCAQRDATGRFDDEGKLIEPETTAASACQSLKIEAEYNSEWNFVVYGIGTSQDASGFVAKDGTAAADKKDSSGKDIYSSGYTVMKPDGVTPNPAYGKNGVVTPTLEDDDDFLRLWTWNGKGKIVPGDTDGLAFYYTKVNPQVNNFKLSANLHVNQWRIGNGQEGFGLLAADWIGKDGDTSYHWTNSYTAVASKVDYKWDSVNNEVSTTGGTGVTLRIGIGSTAKTGVTAENLPIFKDDVTTATTKYYNTETLPLDTSVHTDKYNNLIGNETLGSTVMVPNPVVDLKLAIELNETGYYISYTPLTKNADGTFTEGATVTNKYYDRNALSMCEENTAYVGFFATRYADVTYSNVNFTTSPYDPEVQPEARPTEEVELKASFSGASTANNEDYDLIYSANWKGTVTIVDESGAVLAQETIAPRDGDIEEEGKITVPVKLHIGANKFQVTYTPDRNYDPYKGSPHTILTSYEPKVSTITVTWNQYGKAGDILYVSPKGKATGDGTKVNPLDIYTAVKYAQPGQTIYLTGGTYNLTKTVKIDRGINGTEDKKIYMLADPETCTKENGVRPVLDFNSQCPAMVVAGDWWYLQGFDVTRSGNQMKGIQICGDHNVLDGLKIYKNGSTGLQISRLLASDKFEDWPSYNTILNCTAYLNADAGYTDADGFAAKLTVGNGNVFDGCISAYNADDGWDLFAKVWTGPIGIVTLQNCVSFENGQVIRDKATHDLVWFDESDNYEIVDAGSGNGYKMGGSSITGYHTLKNSVAFRNKSKGIDSNSCNDIQAYNSISFDNKSYNVAMYSNSAKTDFQANGVISYRKNVGTDVEDRIGLKNKNTVSSIISTQEDCVEKIFNNTNFFWNKIMGWSEPGSEYYQHYTTCTDEDAMKEKLKNSKPSVSVSDDWFKSVDYEKWVNDNCETMNFRNEDGTINLHEFLELSDTGKAKMAEAGVKGVMGLGAGQISQNANDLLDKVTGETSGNVNTGGDKNDTSNTESGVAADDFAQMPGNAEEVGLWIAIVDRDQIEYTGKAVKPVVNVYSGSKRLKAGKDYTVTYKNNLNAYVGAYDDAYYDKYSEVYAKYDGVEFATLKGAYSSVSNTKKPTIIVKAKGNYKNYNTQNITQVYFDINPVSLTDDALNRIGTGDIALVSKNGSSLRVNPTVTFNNKKLSSVKDYSFETYNYNTDESGAITETPITTVNTVGSYKVKIAGKNNFAGITSVNLNVVDGTDKNVLAANFKLKGKIPDKYREGYNLISVDEAKPLPVTLSTTGDQPDLVVLDKSGNTLEEGKHYTLRYKNNIDIGTAAVIVTGKSYTDDNGNAGVYVGSKEFKFRIVAPTFNTMIRDQAVRLIDTSVVDTVKVNGMLKITSDTSALKDFGDNHTYQYEGKAVDPVNDELVDSSGSKNKLGLAVKRGNDWYLLVQDKDYKLTYRNNTRQGNAAAVFKGIGNYKGSVTQKFKITPFDLDDETNRIPQEGETVSKIGGTFELTKGTDAGTYTSAVFEDGYSNKTYTGLKVAYRKSGIKPTVSLRINGNQLKAGRDYTVTYKNNTKPTEADTPANKMPTIIIRGRNGLKGTLTGTFTISKKSLDDTYEVIKVTAQDVRISKSTNEGYTGRYTTRIVVKDAQGKTLSAGSDYSRDIKYELVDNSTYKPIEELTGNTVTISKDHPDQYLTVKATVYPNKDSKYYTAKGTDGISTYYRVLYTKNSLSKATFTVNYAAVKDDDTCLYEITNDNKAFYYYEDGINLNGSLLTVKFGNDELVWGEDFVVDKYVGNDRRGTAKLIIKGKGKYFDTKVITFRIVPKDFKWWQKPAAETPSEPEVPDNK